MLSFLFWNVKGVGLEMGDPRYYRLQQILLAGVADRRVDMLILAESPFQGKLDLPGFLPRAAFTEVKVPSKAAVRLEIYYKPIKLTPLGVTFLDRAFIQTWRANISNTTFSLATAHFNSSSSRISDETRRGIIRQFAGAIVNHEDGEDVKHTRTIVVGDFNFDPWDLSIRGPDYLLAVPAQSLAKRKNYAVSRLDLSRRFFYNPMWSHLGDRGNTVPGTYYLDSGQLDTQFWHTFDQVLLRPELLDFWADEYVEVLTALGTTSIVKNDTNIPDKDRYSDHLPVWFRLNL